MSSGPLCCRAVAAKWLGKTALVVLAALLLSCATLALAAECEPITVRSRSIVSNFIGGLQTLFGGNISAYTSLCEQARSEA